MRHDVLPRERAGAGLVLRVPIGGARGPGRLVAPPPRELGGARAAQASPGLIFSRPRLARPRHSRLDKSPRAARAVPAALFKRSQEIDMPHESMASCIRACFDCAETCNHCAAACLQEQDVKMMARCIALDIDCAEICALAAAAMSRASESSKVICAACAEVCRRCADECSKHKMQHCQQCAQACQKCAQECRAMAEMA
ncbi:four-helix bundle copper-binding protein [Ramlibacter sp.]|uniref:four-helix bundle copper-binding protein n=1 Tax=Ramlibacter sp. TaxID=1917967 RepID=UPI003D0BE272